MTFQFLCPQGHLLQGEEEHMGMQCQCPQCGVAFIIPTVGAAQPSSAAPQIDLAPLDEPDPMAGAAPSRSAPGGPATEQLNVGGLAEDLGGELDDSDLGDAAVGETLLHIPCPNGHELDTPLDMIGAWVMCPHCQAEFRPRREKSIEYLREQEIIDAKRAQFWFKLAIVTAGIVGFLLLVMIVVTAIT